jgi:hypothetical protein
LEIGSALESDEATTLAFAVVLAWGTIGRLGSLGILRNCANYWKTALDDRIGRSVTTLETRKLLLIDIHRKCTEIVLESTPGWDVGSEAETRTDILGMLER